MAKRIGTFVIVGLVLLFAWMGYDYLHYRAVNAVSDAAFIKSDRLAMLAFKVDGKVIELTKEANAPVRKGELLGRIDPKDFEVTKAQILHSLQALNDALAALRLKRDRLAETLAAQKAISAVNVKAITQRIASLGYRIEAAQRRLKKLDRDTARYKKMLKDRLIASGDFETILTERDVLADNIAAMRKELGALKSEKAKVKEALKIAELNEKQIKELDKQIAAKTQELKAQSQRLTAIEDKIGYTHLYAPFDGVIAKKFTDAPRVLESGTPVYALADPKALYCEVLLSEKKLHGVEPGNAVTITVDAVKDRIYHGRVESIAPTSASTFSLVPRDIASGEFTKLDQRFVVRIRLDEIEGLRAGMGATVAIERK